MLSDGNLVVNAAVADGLVPTTVSGTSPDGKTKVALVVPLDTTPIGIVWTHKPGQSRATDVDNSGVTISNWSAVSGAPSPPDQAASRSTSCSSAPKNFCQPNLAP